MKRHITMQKVKHIPHLPILLNAALMVMILLSPSCNKYSTVDCETYDYSNCIEDEPSSGNLEIRVSITSEQPAVPITIFEGKYPSSSIIMEDTLITAIRNISLPAGKHYAVTAKYLRNGKSIIAVDGDEISKKVYDVCEAQCWEVKNGEIDLRLSND